ncbi:MAG: hypothetical protein Kow0079_08190 [Vicingaceae bacterium]
MEDKNTNNDPSTELESTKDKKSNRIFLVLTILLFGFCGFMIWQYMEQQKKIETLMTEKSEVSTERDNLQIELEEMLEQYNAMETDNEELKAELEAEKAKIEDLLKKVKNKDWTIYKLKKETNTLRKIMQGYVHTIDSLNLLNVELREENTEVKKELNNEKAKVEEINKVNEALTNKVNIAARLKIINLRSFGVKVKSNNTGKETEKASRVDKIRTIFTVLENKVTEPGKKPVYLRILSPDGKVLTQGSDESYKFTFNGVEGYYSVKKVIDYQNQTMEVTMDWIKNEDFTPGEYIIEVYADGADIGKTKLVLK